MDQADFFKEIWGDLDGVTSLFFKKGEKTKNRHYKFPEELPRIVATINDANSAGYECFFAPALLSEEGRKKKNFKVSNVVWADFDTPPRGVLEPLPTIVVETSPNHTHVYWKLEIPLSDPDQLEFINRRLANAFGADACWDATRLLRVPGTNNFKRNSHPVAVVSFQPSSHVFTFSEGELIDLKGQASRWRQLYYKSLLMPVSLNLSWREVKGIVRLRSINSLPYWEKEEQDLKLLRRLSGMRMKGGVSSSSALTMRRGLKTFLRYITKKGRLH